MKNKPTSNSKLAIAIFNFLVNEKEITASFYIEPFFIRRTYAGYWQKAAGAWTWWLEDAQGREICGSQWTATDCVKSIKENSCVTFRDPGGMELIPFDKNRGKR